MLAAAVTKRTVSADGGEAAGRTGESPTSVGWAAHSSAAQHWIRLPLGSHTGGRSSMDEALRAALAVADPSMPWVTLAAEHGTAGAPEDRVVEVEEPGKLPRRYVLADPSAQSPSAHDSLREGFLFGYRPFLFPWPPAMALFGSLAWAVTQQM